jgi:hypothetical protein
MSYLQAAWGLGTVLYGTIITNYQTPLEMLYPLGKPGDYGLSFACELSLDYFIAFLFTHVHPERQAGETFFENDVEDLTPRVFHFLLAHYKFGPGPGRRKFEFMFSRI